MVRIMNINAQQKKLLRTIGHKLKPIITVAKKGRTKNVDGEIERALSEHELIKIKLVTSDRAAKKELMEGICTDFAVECIQSIGQMVLLYRRSPDPDPRLSNILRNKKPL
jgi:RNA-binding protein